MRRMQRMVRGLGSACVLALTVGLVGPAHASTYPAVSSAPVPGADTLGFTSRHLPVDHPGGEVRERIGVHLGAAAKVYLRIREPEGRYVRVRVPLGTLSPGWHQWTWAGRADDGTRVPDGWYEVTIVAIFSESGVETRGFTQALVHRFYQPGRLTSTYGTLYPRSTTVHDSTTLVNRPLLAVKSTLRIRNAAGEVVFRRVYQDFRASLRVRWDGRDRRGRALPPGTYYVRVSGVDADGLSGRTRARAVQVSAKKLLLRTRTVTLSPAASSGLAYPRGCNGCIEYPECGTVVASERFSDPGALSYRSGPGCPEGSVGRNWSASTRHPFTLDERAPRGYGEVIVSAFGGPTTPHASDQGVLTVLYGATATRTSFTSGTSVSVTTGSDTSDHTTTAPAVPISVILDDEDKVVPGFRWRFSTNDGDSYDVASFTLSYTFLTPQA